MQWTIDPAHSHIQFSIRHMGLSTVRGTFGQLSGTIEEENGNVASVDAVVDVASINTNVAPRDAHLRGADFFDVEKHPQAHLQITNSVRSGDEVTFTGNLTMHGVTKPITLKGELAGPAKDPWGNMKVSASLEGKIARSDWGLVYNAALEAGGFLLGDEVKLLVDVQAAATPAAVAA